MKEKLLLWIAVALTVPGIAAGGAIGDATAFSEDFEVDPTAAWTVNVGPSDEAADFFFDYSTVGIPLAPNSGPGGLRGLKLQANLANGILSGFSVSPTGENFVGDYDVTFDWWANFNGPLAAGGNGSGNLSTFGIGTTGTVVQWPGGAQDSVWFAATGDGGSAADWRAYSTAAPGSYGDSSPIYAAGAVAGNRNNTHAYYADLGGVAAPAAQLALFPQQSGATVVGSAGMEWHQVTIRKQSSTVIWRVDGLVIATIDLATVTLGGGNIFFGHADTNATSSVDPNDASLLFTLIDNIVVTASGPLDVDASGEADPLTDGLLILRFLFGFTGNVLVSGAVAGDCTRCDTAAIEGYLEDLL